MAFPPGFCAFLALVLARDIAGAQMRTLITIQPNTLREDPVKIEHAGAE
jgi:hypothetical protein